MIFGRLWLPMVLLYATAGAAQAQSYPTKPVRIVVGFAAGGSIDIVARRLAQKLTESLGQQFIIDNRVGAGSVIGTDFVAKAAPDGYTLLLSGVTGLAAGASVFKQLPYDTFCIEPELDMSPKPEAALPAELIAQEAALLHNLPPRPPGRDEELGREVARLNKAVAEAAEELSFDDQPADFLATLIALREVDER